MLWEDHISVRIEKMPKEIQPVTEDNQTSNSKYGGVGNRMGQKAHCKQKQIYIPIQPKATKPQKKIME